MSDLHTAALGVWAANPDAAGVAVIRGRDLDGDSAVAVVPHYVQMGDGRLLTDVLLLDTAAQLPEGVADKWLSYAVEVMAVACAIDAHAALRRVRGERDEGDE